MARDSQDGRPGSDGPAAPAPTGRPADRRIALGIFLFVAGLVCLLAGGHTYSSDEEGYLQTTQAFLRADIGIPIDEGNNRVTPVRAGRDDKPVAGAGIGQSVVMLPLLAVGRGLGTVLDGGDQFVERVFAGFTNGAIHGLTCVFLFLLCRELGARQRDAMLLAVVYGVATMAFVHAKTMFSEPMSAMGLTGACWLALRATRTGRWRDTALAGGLITVSMFARLSVAPFAALIALFLLVEGYRHLRLRGAATLAGVFAAATAAGFVVIGLVNAYRFGSSTDSGYGDVPFVFSLWDGLYGLLLSPGKSVFLYAPVAVVAVAALIPAVRRRPAAVVLLALISAANVYLFARFEGWHGGQAWGPRYLEITLPLAVALVAPVISRGRGWRAAVVVAGVLGVAVNWGGVVLYDNHVYWTTSQRVPVKQWPDGQNAWHVITHTPSESPVVQHLESLPEVARVSAARVDRRDASFVQWGEFPQTINDRYDWYITSAQLDTWWYLLFPAGKPRVLLVLVPVFLLAMAFGFRRCREASW